MALADARGGGGDVASGLARIFAAWQCKGMFTQATTSWSTMGVVKNGYDTVDQGHNSVMSGAAWAQRADGLTWSSKTLVWSCLGRCVRLWTGTA